ncbi:MAG TPA: hypothetical protein VGD74_10600, partial [Vulgatibacter sp.]
MASRVGSLGLVAAVVLVLSWGCGTKKDPDGGPTGGVPEILEFSASPSTIERGERTTLTWRTDGAESIRIVDGGGEPIDLLDSDPADGSAVVEPPADQRYELIAVGPTGETASDFATVTVLEPGGGPRILVFDARPGSGGGETELFWKVAETERVRILDGLEHEIFAEDPAGEEGSTQVRVERSSTFVLEAEGSGITVTAEVRVDVPAAPVVAFEAADEVVDFGASTVLRWEVEDATGITIADGAGAPVDVEPSGQLEVSPTSATTFELVATGQGGRTVASATVAVRPVIDQFE